MGVEYERYLIAKGSFFAPSGQAIASLVKALRAESWIAAPGSPELARLRFAGKRNAVAKTTGGYAVKTVDNTFGSDLGAKIAATTEAVPANLDGGWLDHPAREDLRLVWPVDGDDPLPVKYPLTRKPDGAVTFALEIHRSGDYVYPISSSVGPVPTLCACGDDLAFGWDDDEVVTAFGAATGIYGQCEACSRTFDPSRGTATVTNPFDGSEEQVRGGAAYRFAIKVDCGACVVHDPKLAFAPDLVALVEKEFGREFYEVGSSF